ncbi:hypothetical protein GCM10022415_03980 [Knoellia locipacati]|uniref:Histidine kinase/HSP90-like ATPase domain-containing protein n=1 Tax=Knoellia locipacati TaxID=882824 RepID=A0A512SWL5_9MICO|nr:ATP-binding protein [Knoellia locipacati]GEQ12350.1 hypothetical protein KLO01_03970 [Knoellia locipacati]
MSRWADYAGRLPSTARGTDHAVALLTMGIRLGTLVQMVPGLVQGVSISPRPGLYAVCWGAAAASSLVVSLVVFRRGGPLSRGGFTLDLSLAIALMLLGSLTVTDAFLVGSWIAPFPAHLLAVLCTGAAVLMPRWQWVCGVVAACAASFVFAAPAWDSDTATTIVANVLTLVVLSSVGRLTLGYFRRVAQDGDLARAEATELGRREEERRAQLAIHNGAAVIRMLSDPTIDEQTRRFLQKEAQLESARMRSYLQGRGATQVGPASGAHGVALRDVVGATCDRFLDLPLHLNVDLAEGAHVDAGQAAALDQALASLLLNVRDHAGAESVVVHADAPPAADGDAETWVVTLHDDGVGFEVSAASMGVGLRQVVVGEMRRRGMDVTISSTPGVGTTVTLTGPCLAMSDEGTR